MACQRQHHKCCRQHHRSHRHYGRRLIYWLHQWYDTDNQCCGLWNTSGGPSYQWQWDCLWNDYYSPWNWNWRRGQLHRVYFSDRGISWITNNDYHIVFEVDHAFGHRSVGRTVFIDHEHWFDCFHCDRQQWQYHCVYFIWNCPIHLRYQQHHD